MTYADFLAGHHHAGTPGRRLGTRYPLASLRVTVTEVTG
jgi:hypothetical protein